MDREQLWDAATKCKTEQELKSLIDTLSEEDVKFLLTSSNPYKEPVVKSKLGYLLYSFVNFKDVFHKKLLQHSFEKFIKQAMIEYTPKDADKYPSEMVGDFAEHQKKNIVLHLVELYKNDRNKLYSLYLKMGPKFKELTDQLKEEGAVEEELDALDACTLDEIAKKTKEELNIDLTREEYVEQEISKINDFLDHYLKEDARFHRNFSNYVDVRYDELVKETEERFSMLSDIDYTIIPLESFQTLEECEQYKEKYGKLSTLDILCVKYNVFNLMAPIAQNREKIQYYNEQNSILKKMVDECQSDMKIGQQVMMQKMKNNGGRELPPELQEYIDTFNSMDRLNVKSLKEFSKQVNADKGDPKMNEIKIDVNVIEPIIAENKPITKGRSLRYHYNL
jgi:hypothetical protein